MEKPKQCLLTTTKRDSVTMCNTKWRVYSFLNTKYQLKSSEIYKYIDWYIYISLVLSFRTCCLSLWLILFTLCCGLKRKCVCVCVCARSERNKLCAFLTECCSACGHSMTKSVNVLMMMMMMMSGGFRSPAPGWSWPLETGGMGQIHRKMEQKC